MKINYPEHHQRLSDPEESGMGGVFWVLGVLFLLLVPIYYQIIMDILEAML